MSCSNTHWIIVCNKHYIRYRTCYKLEIPETPFYPDAYKFINTKDDFLSIIKLINGATKKEVVVDINKLDYKQRDVVFK